MRSFLIAALYCLSVFVANLLAGVLIPLPFFGLLSLGTVAFGATFTLRDYAHQYGRTFVYRMIAVAALVNVIGALLTDTPLRFVIASFITIVIAESVDTEVYHRINAAWMYRVMGSNAVSIPTDSVLFALLAFGGTMPWIAVAAIIWADIVVKTLVGTLVGAVRVFRTSRTTAP
jgi:uncharacterized PurR-regulated membrane protein YhhQ (DUF165 family)